LSNFKNNWKIEAAGIRIHADILSLIWSGSFRVELNYYGVLLENTGSLSTRNEYTEMLPGMLLSRAKSANTISLDENEVNSFLHLIQKEPAETPSDSKMFEIWRMEYIEKGWRSYF
jgi:hypothetical protein